MSEIRDRKREDLIPRSAAKKQHEVNPQKFCSVVLSEENQLIPVPKSSHKGEKEDEPKKSKKPERFPWESRRAYKRRLENKPLSKIEDPGKFVIPVSINGYQLDDCLCDTGDHLNIMSHALAKDLGFKKIKDPKVKVEFADLSCMELY
ncbi:unnamed protein product [Microthlaspi erraticum]|uniref:Aspartic peptidase DDI1-type domain-containing protein n=1 Tax=Microthlaspi erraticum TaxID=1685480 RepID=A0A6D2IJ97_9BRAS|nr:unnamed protein product [Microthlaspi erraticum]